MTDQVTVTVSVDADRLAALNALLRNLAAFRTAQADGDRGEPRCGYPEYDATVTDYCRDITEVVEGLIYANVRPEITDADVNDYRSYLPDPIDPDDEAIIEYVAVCSSGCSNFGCRIDGCEGAYWQKRFREEDRAANREYSPDGLSWRYGDGPWQTTTDDPSLTRPDDSPWGDGSES